MERASDKHAQRLDDAMAADTRSMTQGAPIEARDRDERLQEGGEGPEAVARFRGLDAPAGPGLGLDERDGRSELARHLRPSAFPGDREALLAVARDENAPGAVLEALGVLPEGVEFANVEAVWEALGGHREARP
ncbi:MAG TPA: DUF2795 domain-containing protein [Acidimicrobiales bacterium]|jgi:hypothetical protein|nr:DUF2795 domain-containing protein [Acidimicrobiales bacterium]